MFHWFMMSDTVHNCLKFVGECYTYYIAFNINLGIISLPLAFITWFSVYYVLYKVFYDWPMDYRCWRAGKASFSIGDYTDDRGDYESRTR